MSQMYQHGNEATTKKSLSNLTNNIFFPEKLHNYTLSFYFDSFKNFSRLEKLCCDCLQQFQVTCLGTCAIITHSDLCYKLRVIGK